MSAVVSPRTPLGNSTIPENVVEDGLPLAFAVVELDEIGMQEVQTKDPVATTFSVGEEQNGELDEKIADFMIEVWNT